MRRFILALILVVCACANENDDLQQVQQFGKSVKGGHGNGFQYNPGANLVQRFGNNTQQGQGWAQNNQQGQEHWAQNNQQGQEHWAQNNQQGQDSWAQTNNRQGQDSWSQTNNQRGQDSWAQTNNQQGQGYWAQNNSRQGQDYWRHNLTAPVDLEVGVCFVEVPTVRLAKDPNHVPAGNGSRPDLSRIRTCCKGFIRNIHNFRKCDPVCTQECVNALCTSPDICTCFPDHVKNAAGFCIPTCPIGCQNGRCEGTQCRCKDGFKLDSTSKYCVPTCKENCGGIGNCTAPDTCECKTGYQTGPLGSCKPVCDRCTNGECVAPNECQCRQGYRKDQQGLCAPHCDFGYQPTPQGCKPVCERCVNGDCVGPNDCRCHQGYVNQQGQCEPHCSPDCGPSSRCVSPNVCNPPVNNQVYQPSNQSSPLYPGNQHIYPQLPSIPQCSQPCLNGVCGEGNRCVCNPGYTLDSNDPTGSRCLPHCSGGCTNGVCSAPNFCICNMGYYKDHSVKGRQTCVKRVKRSAPKPDVDQPLNVAELLTFEIPDY